MMNTPLDISVLILTLNEEIHIRRCVENAMSFAKHVYVVDCFSKDRTAEIAESLGAEVFPHAWPGNHAEQVNWALDSLPIETAWVMRIDADEYLFPETVEELRRTLPDLGDETAGILLFRCCTFMGKVMKHGISKMAMLRIFRFGYGRSEVRLMDEHIALDKGGGVVTLQNGFIDDNLNHISWWAQKHLGYAVREAAELLNIEYGLSTQQHDGEISAEAKAKRNLKLKYARQPLFWRSFAYFCYRYFFRLGFLDGKEGFLWHFMQGWWYRTLVDAKVFEIKKACGNDKEKVREYLKTQYNITIE